MSCSSKLWNLRGVVETPKFVSEVRRVWGFPDLWLVPELRTSCRNSALRLFSLANSLPMDKCIVVCTMEGYSVI